MIEAVLGALALILVTIIGYVFGRRKNTSEIKKNEADTKKSEIEADKLDTENKIMQVELFERLNGSLEKQINILLESNKELTLQSEKLLESNKELAKTNETLISQNKKLFKEVRIHGDRIKVLESKFSCGSAATCINKTEVV